ncbi:MAG: FtsW/RodA/SpoVE family cell cycle protein [Bacillota bacterium]|nr:FtsW/RodA/SpoVE family cell cycle protein [Bacillota bacterium]
MKQTIQYKDKQIQTDFGFIVILLILGSISLFALYNAFNLIKIGSGFSYLMKQGMWYGVGFFVLFFLSKIQNKVIFSYMKVAYKYLMYALLYLFVSMMLYKFTGRTLPLSSPVNGAVSWFQIPAIGSFQPSEFIKIVLIVMTAQTITEYQDKHKNPTILQDFQMLIQVAKFLLPPLILIFMQPDTGLCIIIAFTTLVIVMCCGIRKEYIYALVGSIVVVVALVFYLYFFQRDFLTSLVSAYRLQRIDAWLDPESNILGSSNQLYTSLLSLGSAGLTGYGLQANIVSIPEAHTDFIFAAIGQCFGLIGTTIVILICIILDIYLLRIAFSAKKRQDKLIVIGVVAMLLYQQVQNTAMIVGLLPITGITLPLISYGGSSILSYFISFGIVMNISPVKKKTIRVKNPFEGKKKIIENISKKIEKRRI